LAKKTRACREYTEFAPMRKHLVAQLPLPVSKYSDPVLCAKTSVDPQLVLKKVNIIHDYSLQVIKQYNSAVRKMRISSFEDMENKNLIRKIKIAMLSKHVMELDSILKELHYGCWEVDVPEVEVSEFVKEVPLVAELDPSSSNAYAGISYKSFAALLIDNRGDKTYRLLNEIVSKAEMKTALKALFHSEYRANPLVMIFPSRKGGKTITMMIISNNKTTMFDIASFVAHTLVATVMDKGRSEWSYKAAAEIIETIKSVYERISNKAPKLVGLEVTERIKKLNLGYNGFRRTVKDVLKAVPDVDNIEFLGMTVIHQFAAVINTLSNISSDKFEEGTAFLIPRYMPPVGRPP